jgi:hypothetical protein
MTITNKTRATIMKTAWKIARQDRITIAHALRRAWLWMKRKLGLIVASVPAPRATQPAKANGAGWAKPIPVHTSNGNRVVWNIGRSYGRSSGYGAWIGR